MRLVCEAAWRREPADDGGHVLTIQRLETAAVMSLLHDAFTDPPTPTTSLPTPLALEGGTLPSR
ncbi:hypothetical protein E2C01_002150 [Portunus trituberculatus]|uniref:Uncharacterized protein n=1 Tax=Portunus trituberculatus TaxID=210409 RepID=A0A5B7CIZ7_PORTR|nr:hypothetical protein [Portunus trituberculatus]